MTDSFKLLDLLNSRSKQWEEKEEDLEEQQDGEGVFDMIDIDLLVPSKENFYSLDKKEAIKASIRLVGLEQPLRVEPIDQTGEYKVLAGHCRLSALIELAEEDEKYRNVPCYVKDQKSEQLSQLTMLLTNFTQREPTEYEKMLELTEIEKIAKKLKQQENIPGRVRDMIAELLSISSGQIGRYTAIRNNLGDHLMEAFRNQEIGMSTAYEASGLKPGDQIKLYALLKEKGKLEIPDVKAFKRMEETEKEVDNMSTDKSSFKGAMNEPEEPDREPDPEEPRPEGKTSDQMKKAELPDNPDHKGENSTCTPESTAPGNEQKPDQSADHESAGSRIEKGCGFCAPQNHREISTMEGGTLINLDPEKKQLQILYKEIGVVESVTIVACPLCGRIL